MAIEPFGQARMPASDNSTTLETGPTITFTPPASMVAGHFVFVWVEYRGQVTWTVSNSGGQSWSSSANQQSSTTNTARLFWCVFNGTWTASPIFTVTSGTSGCCGWMGVVSGVNTASPWDVTPVIAAQSSSSTFVLGTWNTLTPGAWATAGVSSVDNNTWTVDNSFVAPSGAGNIYWRTQVGSDSSVALARKAMATAGAVGATTFTQSASGPDLGTKWYGALRPAIVEAVASGAGVAASVVVGATILASAFSGAGLATAEATGAATAAAVASTAGISTAAAEGAIGTSYQEGAAAATGIASAQAAGASTVAAAGSSSGLAVPSAVGAATAETAASASGLATGSGVGAATCTSQADSAGTSSAAAIGAVTAAGQATASGIATCAAVSESQAESAGAGSAQGIASALAVGASTTSATAESGGLATVAATGSSITAGAFEAGGVASVSAIGATTAGGVAASAGLATAEGVGESEGGTTDAIATAAGICTTEAIGAATWAAIASAEGGSAALAIAYERIPKIVRLRSVRFMGRSG